MKKESRTLFENFNDEIPEVFAAFDEPELNSSDIKFDIEKDFPANRYWKMVGVEIKFTPDAIKNFKKIKKTGCIDLHCAHTHRRVRYCNQCIHFADCLDKGYSLIMKEKDDENKRSKK